MCCSMVKMTFVNTNEYERMCERRMCERLFASSRSFPSPGLLSIKLKTRPRVCKIKISALDTTTSDQIPF